MKKLTAALIAFASVMTVAGTAAAEGGKLGVDGALVFPTGDWSDVAGIGIGGLVAGRYHIDPNLALTGRVGYIHHMSKDQLGLDITTSEIPVLAGVKYYFDDMEGPYVAGEFGWVSMRVKMSGEIMGQSFDESDSEGRFGMTLGGGYEVSNVDFRGQLFMPNLLGRDDGEDTQMGLMLNVGYRFMEF